MEPHGSPHPQARLLFDEWDAMREVHEILRHYDEPTRRRIMEAVNARLGDETAVQAHGDQDQ